MGTIVQGSFEWDEEKSESNFLKHGITFDEAIALFRHHFYEFALGEKYFGEMRCLAIGIIREKEYTAVLTKRDGRRRLISVRRARPKEREIFWSSYGDKNDGS